MAEFMDQIALRVLATKSLRERLAQDEVWTDASGETRRLEDLTESHAINLKAWLERYAAQLHDGACGEYLFITPPTADMAEYYFEQEMNAMFETRPLEWLNEQPLMIKLTKLVTEYSRHK